MDVYSDLLPTAMDGIPERVSATLFSGDGSKLVANDPIGSSDEPLGTAQVLDMNGGPGASLQHRLQSGSVSNGVA
jgi:hypothetical protein